MSPTPGPASHSHTNPQGPAIPTHPEMAIRHVGGLDEDGQTTEEASVRTLITKEDSVISECNPQMGYTKGGGHSYRPEILSFYGLLCMLHPTTNSKTKPCPHLEV